AVVVAVSHAAIEHVGDGLEAAVRMIRKAGEIVLGTVGAELIEHQEGVEVGQLRLADHAPQLHSGAIGSRQALDDAPHGAARAGAVAHFAPLAALASDDDQKWAPGALISRRGPGQRVQPSSSAPSVRTMAPAVSGAHSNTHLVRASAVIACGARTA